MYAIRDLADYGQYHHGRHQDAKETWKVSASRFARLASASLVMEK